MDIAKVQFVVLKIEEHKLSDQPYKVKVEVSANFGRLGEAFGTLRGLGPLVGIIWPHSEERPLLII